MPLPQAPSKPQKASCPGLDSECSQYLRKPQAAAPGMWEDRGSSFSTHSDLRSYPGPRRWRGQIRASAAPPTPTPAVQVCVEDSGQLGPLGGPGNHKKPWMGNLRKGYKK